MTRRGLQGSTASGGKKGLRRPVRNDGYGEICVKHWVGRSPIRDSGDGARQSARREDRRGARRDTDGETPRSGVMAKVQDWPGGFDGTGSTRSIDRVRGMRGTSTLRRRQACVGVRAAESSGSSLLALSP